MSHYGEDSDGHGAHGASGGGTAGHGAEGRSRDLVGRIGLVTGGGKGVGRVISHRLAERGAHVLINCFHSYQQAKQTQVEIEAAGGRADVLRASVAKKEQVDRMFDEIDKRFGGLDLLVNNAASGWLGPLTGITPELFAKTMDTNLVGSFLCSVRAASLMAPRGGGAIVNISSIGAGMVPDNYLMVGTSKAGIEALTRHLAAEYASWGIRVNTASCSLIRGDVAELFPDAEEMQRVVIESTPLGRLATAEDLAGVVMFLTSDLSRWVTGQVVMADGGLGLGNVMLSPPKSREAGPPAPRHDAIAAPVSDDEAAAAPVWDDEATTPPASDDETAAPPLAQRRTTLSQPIDDPVAVVGMGLAVPGANSPDEYWRLLEDGAELFVETPQTRWRADAFYSTDATTEDKAYQTRSGFITGFVPDPALAEEIANGKVGPEYTTRWLRHSLHQALRGVHRHDGERVTFAIGYTADGSQHLEEAVVLSRAKHEFGAAAAAIADPELRAQTVQAFAKAMESHLRRGTGDASAFFPDSVARNAMAGLLPEDTDVFVVDTACSSSLYAVDLGMKSLMVGDCELAVCGGAFALGPRGAVLFSQLHGLSTGGVVRSLDASADGVLFSDGAGVVVLKRLSRAVRDGDHVLGVLRGFGSSSDGKGKAIYAPSSNGQRLAVERGLEAARLDPRDLEWVIAHATGTPAGDIAELTTLRETLAGDHPLHVTSNKSLIGHTGWAAGVISLIEAMLAFEHSTIPRQHRFVTPPPALGLEGTSITIPREPVSWPARDRPRAVSISGFGFGGTNAHLVVAEQDAVDDVAVAVDGRDAADPQTSGREPVVIIGWSAHFPGLASSDAAADWLRGRGPTPSRSFGAQYRLPAERSVRIPPSAQRVLDRAQLMFVECMFRLGDGLGSFLEQHAATTGVLAGHMGPTGHAGSYAMRCYLDDLREALDRRSDAGSIPSITYEAFRERVRAAVPASTEDAFPGIMPNIIPARVSNLFDFHGLNMTVDTGFASTLSAVRAAMRYLQTGELDVALVGGINGSSGDDLTDILAARLAGPDGRPRQVAEGAIMFALAREETARANQLPILARIDLDTAGTGDRPTVTCGQTPAARPSYLGAEGALAMLESLLGAPDSTTVCCLEGGREVASLGLSRAGQVAAEVAQVADQDAAEPEQMVARHRVRLVEQPMRPARARTEFLGSHALLLTDRPDLLEQLGADADVTVLSTVPLDRSGERRIHMEEITAASVRRTLAALPHPVTHVRVLTDLSDAADIAAIENTTLHGVLALHDLLFLVLQDAVDELDRDGASVLACLLGGAVGGESTPLCGLFTGLLKSATFELPKALICATITSTTDVAKAVAQASEETAADRLLPVAVYDCGVRKVLAVEASDPLGGKPAVGERAVIVSCGGSRGITAEVLKHLAERDRPTIYVLGSNDLGAGDESLLAPVDRAQYLRTARLRDPSASIHELNQAFDRIADALAARDNLERMAAANGGRVTYLRCDMRDADQVTAAVQRILQSEGRIDLVINAAGINRSGLMRGKHLEDFRAVRDLKVLAYVNLKRALSGHSPLWCNFSSYIGLKGQLGETDYAAANDFVATASVFASRVGHQPEFAIGWNLWRDVGLGATPLMKAFLAKRVWYTRMSTAEGVSHFLRELDQPQREPWSVFMGSAELDHLGLAPAPDGEPARVETRGAANPAPAAFYLGTTISRAADETVFERAFTLDSDPYLRHHLVNDVPTLPGTFAVEIAAEAAQELVPDRVPVRFEQLVFSSFLRVSGERPVTKQVIARVLRRTLDETLVEVRVVTDVTAPDGRTLATGKPHFSCLVRMRDGLAAPPRWNRPERPADTVAQTDPYHVPNPAVHLTGPFVTAEDFWVHPQGCGARWVPSIAAEDPVFSHLCLPVVLLDGLLRVSVPDQAPGIRRALAVPARIERLDIYTDANDAALAAAGAAIDLSSVAPERPGHGGRAVASLEDGRVLALIEGMTAVVVGQLDETGRFVPSDRRRPTTASVSDAAGAASDG